jgi:hypothetical protein
LIPAGRAWGLARMFGGAGKDYIHGVDGIASNHTLNGSLGTKNCVGDEGRYIQPLRGQRGKGSCALCYLCANGERAIRLQVLLETLPSEPGFLRIKSLGFALLAV